MEITKKCLSKFWTIFAGVAAVVIAFAVIDSGGMISYYCVTDNQFFGLYLKSYALCSVGVTLGYILTITLGVMLFLFVVCAPFDLCKNKKKKRIPEGEDSKLNLFAHQGGHLFKSNEQGESILYLTVDFVNRGNRKIIELDAHLSRIYQWTKDHPDDGTICNAISTPLRKRLRWENGSYQIELKPGFSELQKVKIATLNLTRQNFTFIHEGMPLGNPQLQQDAIYGFAVVLKGKLEGDNLDYIFFDFETEFVCSPENSMLDYLPDAAQFPNFPEELKGKLSLLDKKSE